ncbi:MAG TPA: hypothetical protein VK063_12965 [Beutenbergiaceae bacterium]|nr:hypothetical protein [Beutenbergiaceae bacterium]
MNRTQESPGFSRGEDVNRDLVSRNQVSDWLHAEAAKMLAGEL